MTEHIGIILVLGVALIAAAQVQCASGRLAGRVCERRSGHPLHARLYIRDSSDAYHLAFDPDGRWLPHYDNMDLGTGIQETFTLVGPAGFRANLAAGHYRITVERGKEYRTVTRDVEISEGTTQIVEIEIERAFNMASIGWYSADCHVHTPLEDLPAAQLADDVNVAFPLTAWATHAGKIPGHKQGTPRKGELIRIDEAHAYWNLNTEYEVFHIDDELFILGAFMILGHTTRLEDGVPPVRPIAEEAHRQGAVLDWEKHTWPWSAMLVPVANIDTMELSNNSMWRQHTIHAYLWDRKPPPWIEIPLNARRFVEYGFASYYMMLNGGVNLRPSAGSANGVHPVPLGYSRVYAFVDGIFDYEKWFEAYRAGRSFCTNGPMLLMKVDGRLPGERIELAPGEPHNAVVELDVMTVECVDEVEIIVNGDVHRLPLSKSEGGRSTYRAAIKVEGSSWIAARCLERPDTDAPRFAHTGAVWLDDASRPLQPKRREVDYLIATVEHQIERCKPKLSVDAVAEYEQALHVYRRWGEGLGV